MALIPCPACDKQISEMAPACPGCGHPAAALDHPHFFTHQHSAIPVQTIEQTSKKYKFGQLVGVCLILASVISCTNRDFHSGAWLLILGMGIYIVSRMGAWWNNG